MISMMRKTSDLNGMTDTASADFFKLVARFKKVVNTLVKRILFVLPILLSIIVIYAIYIFDFVQRNNVFIRRILKGIERTSISLFFIIRSIV